MDRTDDGYDTPYPTANPWDTKGPGSPFWQAVKDMYQTALGRPPESDQVIQQWIDGTGGDLAKIQQGIYGTPEAQAYGSRNAQAPKATETPSPTPAPTPAPAPISAAASAPNLAGPAASAPSSAPAPSLPSVPTAPAFQAPPAFTYDKFTGPTANDVLNDDDYKLTRDQGIMAIGHKNAALGTLNTGGTIGDYVGFASNLAHAKYGDIYNRQKSTYDTNRAGAFDAWKANYGVSKDTYDTNYQTQYADPFREGLQQSSLTQNNNQFNAQLGQNNSQFNSTFDFQKWLENYKRDVTDPFEMRYKTLGLL